ncbi:MAG: 6-bladed beta-propeller [Balneolaceae bacterium]|nr:6-bladed beta-propeller [Balneolaceae bacterium]
MKYITLIYILCFLCISCTEKKPSNNTFETGVTNYTLKLDYQVRENELFSNVTKAKILPNNRVLVHDFFEFGVSMFDADGQFIQRVGNRGRGPQELTRLTDFASNDNYLFLLDADMRKIVIHNLNDLSFVKDISLEKVDKSIRPEKLISGKGAGLYVVFYTPFRGGTGNIERIKHVFKLNTDTGKLLKLDINAPEDDYYIEDKGNGITVADLPFMRRSLFRAYKNRLFFTWTDSMTFHSYISTSETIDTLDFYFYKRPVLEEDIISHEYYEYLNSKQRKEIEETWPAMENFFVDENTIHVITNIPTDNNYTKALVSYSIQKETEPQVLAKIPENITVIDVKGDTICGIIKEDPGYKLCIYSLEQSEN